MTRAKNASAFVLAAVALLAVMFAGWQMADVDTSSRPAQTTVTTVPDSCLNAIKASRAIHAYRVADDPTSTDPVVMEMHQQIQAKIADQRAIFKAAAKDCRSASYTAAY